MAKKKECEKPQETEKAVDAEVIDQPEVETDAVNSEIEKLKAELNQKNDMLLRTAAEFDNFKKRETAAKEKLSGFIKGETIKALLPAIDNINRAMAADPDSADYAKGVAMTVKGLYEALKAMGLEEINPEGEEFDVNLHQAVMRVEDESVGANIVTQVLQMGYKLGDNVLRHAMVKVANCDL